MKSWKRQCLLAVVFLAGCAGEGVGFSADGLYEGPALGDVQPLSEVDASAWQEGPAGCEGRLDEAMVFAVAEGAPELIVALDAEGAIICVDSFASVESELLERSSPEADALWLGYVATMQSLEGDPTEFSTTPQETEGEDTVSGGDVAADSAGHEVPTVQPRILPTIDLSQVMVEPEPQPSITAGGGSQPVESTE